MVLRYGKNVDMKSINRDINVKKEYVKIVKRDTQKFCNQEETVESNPICRICGSYNTHFYMNAFNVTKYYECENCQTVFIDKIPDTSKMYVNDEDFAKAYIVDDSTYLTRINMIVKPKIDWIMDVLKENGININSWIDIGCGNGELLYYLQNEKKVDCYGVDTDLVEIESCKKKGINVKKHLIDPNDSDGIKKILENKTVISFFNFLEHLEEPKKFINVLCENIAQGTVIVFEVPRHPSAASFANRTSPNLIYRHIAPPYHIHIFGENGIEYLLKGKAEIIGKWGFGQGFVDILDNAMFSADIDTDKIYNKLLGLSNQVQKIIDENGLSDTMIYIAKKL